MFLDIFTLSLKRLPFLGSADKVQSINQFEDLLPLRTAAAGSCHSVTTDSAVSGVTWNSTVRGRLGPWHGMGDEMNFPGNMACYKQLQQPLKSLDVKKGRLRQYTSLYNIACCALRWSLFFLHLHVHILWVHKISRIFWLFHTPNPNATSSCEGHYYDRRNMHSLYLDAIHTSPCTESRICFPDYLNASNIQAISCQKHPVSHPSNEKKRYWNLKPIAWLHIAMEDFYSS